MLEQEPVGRVGIDLQARIRDQPGQQVRVAGQDHRLAVTLGNEYGQIDRRARSSSEWFGMPRRTRRRTAPGGSATSSARRGRWSSPKMRAAACCPASRLVADGRRRRRGIPRGSAPVADGLDHVRRPAVHARCALRRGRREHDSAHEVGADERDLLRDEAPIEKPSRSTRSSPSSRGTLSHRGPSARCCRRRAGVAPTPVLLKVMTLRLGASVSRSGSQLSRSPRKRCSSTSGTSPAPTSRKAYSIPFAAAIRCIAASAYLLGAPDIVCSCVRVIAHPPLRRRRAPHGPPRRCLARYWRGRRSPSRLPAPP